MNGSQKHVGQATLINKTGLKPKTATRDKNRHYITRKGSFTKKTQHLLLYTPPNITAPKYIKQLLTDINGETSSRTIIAGNFNTSFITMKRSFRPKVNKETGALNETLYHKNLIDIYRTFCPNQQNTYSFRARMEHS